MQNLRRLAAVGLAGTAFLGVSALGERRASASFIDAGIEAGVVKRSLADTSYKPGFVWQLHAELALIPPILMLGPYATFSNATPDVSTKDSPSSVAFRTFGLRAKLKLPLPGDFKPYGVAGVGYVHADFPDQVLTYCADPNIPAACVSRPVTSATANFAEFILGGGFLYEFASPLALTVEFNWRPSVGYKNDVYQKQLQNQSTTAPDPGRNGSAWTLMGGLSLVL